MTTTPNERTKPGTLTKAQTTPLMIKDRCDKCGAQAWMRATRGANETLVFCGHDGAKNLTALLAQGFTVDDQRQRLHNVVNEAKGVLVK